MQMLDNVVEFIKNLIGYTVVAAGAMVFGVFLAMAFNGAVGMAVLVLVICICAGIDTYRGKRNSFMMENNRDEHDPRAT